MLEPEDSHGFNPLNPFQNLLAPDQLEYLKEWMNQLNDQKFNEFIEFINEVAITRLQDARTLKICDDCGKKILEDEIS